MKVTKSFEISIGHRLSDYDGNCRHIHGHNYFCELTVVFPILNNKGMVIDFRDLKEIFRKTIDLKFDHKLVLKRGDPFNEDIAKVCEKYKDDSIVWVDYNPTVENLSKDMISLVKVFIPWGKIQIRLFETSTSSAEEVG